MNSQYHIGPIKKKQGDTIVKEGKLCSGRGDVCQYDSNGNIKYVYEIYHSSHTIERNREGIIWFEFNADEVIKEYDQYIYNAECFNIRCIRIDRESKQPISNINSDVESVNSKIIYSQCGAGSGKTYKSVQS
jgi:hypothetical protein